MKQKTNLLLTVLISFSLVTPVHAIFGAGDVVTDPGSYSYYAEQINELKKQYDQAKELIDTAYKQVDAANKIKNQVYDAATTIMNANDVVKNTVDGLDVKRESKLKRLFDLRKSRGADTIWDIKDSGDMLHDVYVDVAEIDPSEYDSASAAKRKAYKRKALDAVYLSIMSDDKDINKRENDRKKRVDKIINDMNRASTVVDNQKLQTLLLAELLDVTKEIKEMIHTLAMADAIMKYKGTKFEEKSSSKTVTPKKTIKSMAKDAERAGYTPENVWGGNLPNSGK